jgi:hypothetical protein
LVQQFPRENIFMDIDGGIPVGFPWADWLDGQVAACDLMLVLIGRTWVEEFEAGSEGGERDYRHHSRPTCEGSAVTVNPARSG